MEALSQSRDRHTGRYRHPKVARRLGESRADRAMQAAHELAWRDWLRSTVEQQIADLRVYLRDRTTNTEGKERILKLWLNDPPFQAFIPASAHECERQLFLQTLRSLVDTVAAEYAFDSAREYASAFRQALSGVQERLHEPALSLRSLAAEHGVSERHLARLFRQHLGKTFSQHVREIRMQKAALLLKQSRHGVKTIAGMVGYCNASHFGRDFRLLMNCTPTAFRNQQSPA